MKLFNLSYDKKFMKKTLKLALPIAFQNFIMSSLNLFDNIIIGGLGVIAVASVGLANQIFFLLNLVLFGIVSGASIFTSQYWGKEDLKNIKRILGLCLVSSIFASALFMLLSLFFPSQIIGLFSKDSQVIIMGGSYLRIASLSYIFTAVSFAYSVILRSLNQVKAPMVASIISLGINTVLNFVLVYGLGSYAGMGVYGSAIATLIARVIEFIMTLFVVYKLNSPLAGSINDMFDFSFNFIKKFFKITMPVILNESFWALGVTVYAAIYAHMGTSVIAATNIVGTIDRLAMVVFFGFGNAAAIMIGNKIGEKNEKEAFLYAKRFIILNPMIGILTGIVLYLVSPTILSAYNISSEVHTYSRDMLIILSLFLWVKAFNYTNIIGILRSGGDTKYCLFLDIGGMWLIGVPLVALTGLYFHMPIQKVYIFVFMEEISKLIVGLPRIASKKWINNIVFH
ncbi:MAG: MATE family efflux transporter [Clostridiaceae bacterium]